MRAMLAAFVAIALIAIGADYGLDTYAGFSASDRQSSANVRLD